jgi:lipopolysaccharide/colanic/teichoic acid biosynthesis glycosyltransferase
MDCDYAARRSAWLDLCLLARTIGVILRGDGS